MHKKRDAYVKAAPFKSFLSARAHRRMQGIEVSAAGKSEATFRPVEVPLHQPSNADPPQTSKDDSYFFGSRNQGNEYLYGAELEAWKDAGIIDFLGTAFSRDQAHKIYIQHRIKEHGKKLAQQLLAQGENAGYFYLCGPTWPVPDIFNALSEALVEEGNMTREEAEKYLEDLKESERYVLEVY